MLYSLAINVLAYVAKSLWTKNDRISNPLVTVNLIEDLAYAVFFNDTPLMCSNTAYGCSVYNIHTITTVKLYISYLLPSMFWSWCDQTFVSSDPKKVELHIGYKNKICPQKMKLCCRCHLLAVELRALKTPRGIEQRLSAHYGHFFNFCPEIEF